MIGDFEMAKKRTQITVNNPNRSRKWGWGWSCTPTGEGCSIETPEVPDVIGTLKQIANYDDVTYLSVISGGVYTNSAWFYDNKRIVGVWQHGMLEPGKCTCKDLHPLDRCNCHYENAKYGYAFFGVAPYGRDCDEINVPELKELKILVEES